MSTIEVPLRGSSLYANDATTKPGVPAQTREHASPLDKRFTKSYVVADASDHRPLGVVADSAAQFRFFHERFTVSSPPSYDRVVDRDGPVRRTGGLATAAIGTAVALPVVAVAGGVTASLFRRGSSLRTPMALLVGAAAAAATGAVFLKDWREADARFRERDLPPEQRTTLEGRHAFKVDQDEAVDMFTRWPVTERAARNAFGIDASRTPDAVAEHLVTTADADGDGRIAYSGAQSETIVDGRDLTRLVREADRHDRDGFASTQEIARVVGRYAGRDGEALAPVSVAAKLELAPVFTNMLNDREARSFARDYMDLASG